MDLVAELNRLFKYYYWLCDMQNETAHELVNVITQIENNGVSLLFCDKCKTYYDTSKDHVCQPVDKE